jgi:hypothetical protein
MARRADGSSSSMTAAAIPDLKDATCHPVRAHAFTAAPPVEKSSAATKI